ncbi:MAG: hydroxyacid dehydrogenase [Acidobacteria bacterium]|nr:hydroxyacid dehydrogenase [Acidobacteriota bacterium]MCA1611377.1 hydroxyacid dehydrogenase [Acidobacteriota bacterium]
MKVLVADKFEKSGLDGLAAGGSEVLYEPDLKDDALAARIADSGAEILVVRSTKVTRPMLEAGRLSLVIRAGAGYNTIDVEAASERGIYVANCPGKNSVAVAELAFALILSLDRRVTENAADLRGRTWNKKEYSKAKGLFGRTLGILGTGGIGREMIPRARTFGMPVIAWSRSLTAETARELGVERAASPADVARGADIVSIHLALKPETRGLVGADFFEAMRPGAFFINTSRAEVVDQPALERAIREKGIRAGLDVFAGEPAGGTGEVDDPIFQLPGVIGTHHIGASTDQAQEAISAETVRIVREYAATGRAPNVVNLARSSPATHLLVVRHFDRVGVLAAVFDALKEAGINVQETENIVFDGARAAVARVRLDQPASDSVLENIRRSTGDIIEVALLAV